MKRCIHRATLIALALTIAGCTGNGCGDQIEATPGGFPAGDRVANAIQIRLSSSGITAIEHDLAGLLGGLLGGGGTPGVIRFDVPASCGTGPGGASICCDQGTPITPCGPVALDVSEQDGDEPRLELEPVDGGQQVRATVRARLRTESPIPFRALLASCTMALDSAAGTSDHILIEVDADLTQVDGADTTRISLSRAAVSQLEPADLTVGGGPGCGLLDLAFVKDLVISLLKSRLEDTLRDQVELDEIGVAGRLTAATALSGISSGQAGAFDIYDVAGGYSRTDGGGISLGLIGGALPAGQARDRCGPPADRPAPASIQPSPFFLGNTRPDTGEPFDVAIGIHAHTLDLLTWAAYASGFLCLNLGAEAVPLLNTNTLAVLFPSVADLLHGEDGDVILGIRPQRPPVIALGLGTTTTDPATGEEVIDDPLLDVRLDDLDIDFFVMVDDQFIRVLTLSVDVHLPLNLELSDTGELVPLLGSVDDAFTNVTVTNSEALLEPAAELQDKFAAVLDLALPMLGDQLAGFAIPDLGGLRVSVPPGGITAVDDGAFLAIFGDLTPVTPTVRARTDAKLSHIEVPPADAFTGPAFDRAHPPEVELALGGVAANGGPLEWSIRVDSGLWSPFSRSRRVLLRREALWLQTDHSIEVRAREVGRPETVDATPVVLHPVIDRTVPAEFHDTGSAGGCDCSAGGARPAGGSVLLLAAVCFAMSRRPRRWRRGVLVGLAAVAMAAGFGCGSDTECAGGQCLPGEVEYGPVGRYNSIAASDERVVVAAYDQGLGDLVLVDVAQDGELSFRAVDGMPVDVSPTYQSDSYRQGLAEPGPDVGAWTSVALHGDRAVIAYQDIDSGQLAVAIEIEPGEFAIHVVDPGDGGVAGAYASLALDPWGVPSIAYMVIGPSSSELRYALASSANPRDTGDWTIETVDRLAIADPTAQPPQGVGLFVNNLSRPDGTAALVYYDRTRGDLVLAEHAQVWTSSTLDAATWSDIGFAASAIVDGAGTIHVAFQDAIGDQLLYATLTSTVTGTIEIVDDGVRMGEARPHPVGAGAALFVDPSGALRVAYQDGATSDLEIATRGDAGWSRSELAAGPALNGFWVSAATGGGRSYVASYSYDRAAAVYPPGELTITAVP